MPDADTLDKQIADLLAAANLKVISGRYSSHGAKAILESAAIPLAKSWLEMRTALEKCCDFIIEEMGSTNVLTPEPMGRAALAAEELVEAMK